MRTSHKNCGWLNFLILHIINAIPTTLRPRIVFKTWKVEKKVNVKYIGYKGTRQQMAAARRSVQFISSSNVLSNGFYNNNNIDNTALINDSQLLSGCWASRVVFSRISTPLWPAASTACCCSLQALFDFPTKIDILHSPLSLAVSWKSRDADIVLFESLDFNTFQIFYKYKSQILGAAC